MPIGIRTTRNIPGVVIHSVSDPKVDLHMTNDNSNTQCLKAVTWLVKPASDTDIEYPVYMTHHFEEIDGDEEGSSIELTRRYKHGSWECLTNEKPEFDLGQVFSTDLDIELTELDAEILHLEVVGISDPEPESSWTWTFPDWMDDDHQQSIRHVISNYKRSKTKLKKLGWKYVGTTTKLDGRVEVQDISDRYDYSVSIDP